jgi:hypothetical protein
MGTNYYFIMNKCECCGRFDTFHIGKKSFGWQFCFHGPSIKESRIRSWVEWKEILPLGEIMDEYDRAITHIEFIAIVEGSRKESRNHFDECSNSFDDWIERVKDGIDWKDEEGFSFCSGDFC